MYEPNSVEVCVKKSDVYTKTSEEAPEDRVVHGSPDSRFGESTIRPPDSTAPDSVCPDVDDPYCAVVCANTDSMMPPGMERVDTFVKGVACCAVYKSAVVILGALTVDVMSPHSLICGSKVRSECPSQP